MKSIAQKKIPLVSDTKELFDGITREDSREIFTLYAKGSDSLQELGIYDGDCLIVQKTDTNDENQVTLWKDKEGSYLVGFAYDNFGDISINYLLDVARRKSKHIELVGIVVGIMRHFNPQKPIPIEPEEITFVCDTCKKQKKGTTKFIKSEGWELRDDKTVCLNCDLFGGEK